MTPAEAEDLFAFLVAGEAFISAFVLIILLILEKDKNK